MVPWCSSTSADRRSACDRRAGTRKASRVNIIVTLVGSGELVTAKLDFKRELECYRAKAELLRYMHEEFIPDQGLEMVGKHHEIYVSDPRRTEPAKLRTILRQPVADA
jgi:GyrI-like small molecule binding domain